MGPFKFLGQVLASTAKSVELVDNSIDEALRAQQSEHRMNNINRQKDLIELASSLDIATLTKQTAEAEAKFSALEELVAKIPS